MSALCQRMLEDMQLRGLSESTQIVYEGSVRRLAKHYGKSPDQISDEELREYFLYLRNVKGASRSTIRIILSALRFFYEYTLKKELPTLELVRPSSEKKTTSGAQHR